MGATILAIIKTAGHYLIGLAIIGTVGGLAGVGVITATQCIAVLGAVGLPLLGAGISNAGTTGPSINLTQAPKS